MSEDEADKPPQNRSRKPGHEKKLVMAEPASLLRENRNARILHCDDELGFRELLRLLLEYFFKDLDLIQCETGESTLSEIARQAPDLLITDCRHNATGFEKTLPILYRMPQRFPILVYSGSLSPGKTEQLLSVPAFDLLLLEKPASPSTLRNAVLRLLSPSHRPARNRISLARQDRTARLMLLDEDSTSRDLVRTMLPFWFRDYVLLEYTRGDDALHALRRRTPDLLITDYGHAGCPFDALLHRLYRFPTRFPIILSSHYVAANPQLQQRLRDYPGFQIEFLHKPFAIPDLRATVLKCLVPPETAHALNDCPPTPPPP